MKITKGIIVGFFILVGFAVHAQDQPVFEKNRQTETQVQKPVLNLNIQKKEIDATRKKEHAKTTSIEQKNTKNSISNEVKTEK